MRCRPSCLLSLFLLLATGFVAPCRGALTWNQENEGYLDGRNLPLFWRGSSFSSPCAGDVDADGDQDLIVCDKFRAALFRNDGNALAPCFTLVTENLFGHENFYAVGSATLGDLDGDGDLDLLAGFHETINGNALVLYRNGGTPNTPQWNVDAMPVPVFPRERHVHPELGDLNGDGLLDLVLAEGKAAQTGVRLHFYMNAGTARDGDLSSESTVLIAPPPVAGVANEEAPYPRLCDIDGDGDLDLFIGFKGDGVTVPFFRFYRNTGTRTAPQYAEDDAVLAGVGTPCAKSWAPALVDLDGDHAWDLLGAQSSGRFVYYHNGGDAAHPHFENTSFQFSLDMVNESKAEFADLDADGDLDLLLGGRGAGGTPSDGGRLLYYRNDGNAANPRWTLASEQYGGISDPGDNPYESFHPTLGDFDGDGLDELYIVYYYRNHIAQYRNTGTRQNPAWSLVTDNFHNIVFGTGKLDSTWRHISIDWADLDGDRRQDLVVGLSGPAQQTAIQPKVLFYRNLGGLALASPVDLVDSGEIVTPSTDPGMRTAAPAFSDLDGDGDLDLVLGASWGAMDDWRGRLNYFENTGTSQTWNFVRRSPDMIPGMDMGSCETPVLADINGDGLDDLFVGGAEGGLRCFIQAGEKLLVSPNISTLLCGTELELKASGGSLPIQWKLVQDAGGAILNATGSRATYRAGSLPGMIETIEAVDARGRRGRAHINVISTAQQGASGKAVLMAGRIAHEALWQSTNFLANEFYRTLCFRGFDKADIRYLNPVIAQDADANGSMDDVHAASTLAELQDALTSFAADAPNLFVYLIDHGGAQADGTEGHIHLNETETLSAAQLDGWLDALQAGPAVTTLTLVVDCCHSGSFLAACGGAPPGKCRIVIASSEAAQPAFFSAGGLISFTMPFTNCLLNGDTVLRSFREATAAIGSFQQPCMDDDGNGRYENAKDGGLADRIVLGPSFVRGARHPRIGRIMANQMVSSHTAGISLWAAQISSGYPIQRVWATLTPPGVPAQALLSPDDPVTHLPEIELAWNDAAQRYEATLDNLSETGSYQVSFYARDIWGQLSPPKRCLINQTGNDESLVLVCGAGNTDPAEPWAAMSSMAQQVYRTACNRWINPARITWFSNAVQPEVDGPPGKTALLAALRSAVPASRLTLYMVGHADAAGLDLSGAGLPAEILSAAELDAVLDEIQAAGPVDLVLLLDFKGAGAWLEPLKAPPGRKRIVIASCRGNESASFGGDGNASFTHYFMSAAGNGAALRTAFEMARNAIRAVTNDRQNPALDDDGSGTADWLDGSAAGAANFGAAFINNPLAPEIGNYAAETSLSSSTAVLWAAGVWDQAGISGVLATISEKGPGATPAPVTLDLAYQPGRARWEAVFGAFDPTRQWSVIFYAVNTKGIPSLPYSLNLSPASADDIYDRFYQDDGEATLNFYGSATTQQVHNLQPRGDVDWVRFGVDPQRLYTVRVSGEAPASDPRLDLFWPSNNSAPIATRDDHGPGEDEVLTWNSGPTSGTLLLRIRQSDQSPALIGETTYTLAITGDWGDHAGLPTISGQQMKRIDQNGGILDLPQDPPGNFGKLNTPAEEEFYIYTGHKVIFPAGALDSGLDFMIEAPPDIGLAPSDPWTVTWLAAHPGGAGMVHIYTVDGGDVILNRPVQLVMQFVDNGPMANHLFPVDDIPAGFSPLDLGIWYWDPKAPAWKYLEVPQTVSGDTVTAWVTSLGSGLFAVAPRPGTFANRAKAWGSYE